MANSIRRVINGKRSSAPASWLEVAGLLREAWWDAALAARETQVARARLATARDIGRDLTRRAELGDVPPTDALLARSETLAAELSLAQTEALAAARSMAYATLTGGAQPNLPPEAARPAARLDEHPGLATARASLEAAEARQRLVALTPRDNPELSVFGRHEAGFGTDNTSIGLRLRLPLATEQRNLPRRADAQADITRASAELDQQQRLVQAAAVAAEVAWRAAGNNLRLARARLAVANEQEGIARRAFRVGETGAFDLFRVRQLQQEAMSEEARAAVALNRARSQINQAYGVLP